MEDEIFSAPLTRREQIVFFLKTRSRRFWVIFFIASLALFMEFLVSRPPAHFPSKVLVPIEKGSSLSQVSELLEVKSIVKSGTFFKWLVWVGAGDRSVVSGDYFFSSPLTTFAIVSRLTTGNYGLESLRVTIPEGTSVLQMSHILENSFPEFSARDFLALARKDEGYLFPDTYFFLPNVKAEDVYRDMRSNFSKKLSALSPEIDASGKKLKDIIIMASILEGEARLTETRRMVAGILWERLKIGMPLQVDSAFVYAVGKNTSQLSLDDLEIDNPYNTYKYAGLPPGPITNPGLDAIQAALHPLTSPYLYFLTDKEGVMHYAKTHEEHLRNKELYLQ